MIVSDLAVHQPGEATPEGSKRGEYFEGVKINVTPAPGGKCERCWMYSEQVGNDSEHPDLCPRCLKVVKG